MCTARVSVQGLCIVARASAPLCVGFPHRGRVVRGRWLCGCGGRRFLFGLGALLGVGPLSFPRLGLVRVLGHVFSVAGWCCCPALRFSLACTWTSDYAVPGAEKQKHVRVHLPHCKVAGTEAVGLGTGVAPDRLEARGCSDTAEALDLEEQGERV